MAKAATKDVWVLEASTQADVDELMSWFPTVDDVMVWGGPTFRYPFTRNTFFEDVYWGRMMSFSLRDPAGAFAAFGQVYERLGRINLARLVASPGMRGCGVGKRLVELLMIASRDHFSCDEYSLFVFRDNTVAFECYKSMGFVVRDYPDGVPHADVCYYLTRHVHQEQMERGGESHDE